MKFTNRKGTLRLYDGTATTPYYFIIKFDDGNFTGPLGQAKTEEILILQRNRISADMHYIEGGDDVVMEPLPVTFSLPLEDTAITTDLLDWLEMGGTVSGQTVVTTKEDTKRDGTNYNPAFADTTKVAYNVEFILDGETDICWHYNEIYFDLSKQNISESEDGVTLTLEGMWYGTVTRDTAFTSGADVTA